MNKENAEKVVLYIRSQPKKTINATVVQKVLKSSSSYANTLLFEMKNKGLLRREKIGLYVITPEGEDFAPPIADNFEESKKAYAMKPKRTHNKETYGKRVDDIKECLNDFIILMLDNGGYIASSVQDSIIAKYKVNKAVLTYAIRLGYIKRIAQATYKSRVDSISTIRAKKIFDNIREASTNKKMTTNSQIYTKKGNFNYKERQYIKDIKYALAKNNYNLHRLKPANNFKELVELHDKITVKRIYETEDKQINCVEALIKQDSMEFVAEAQQNSKSIARSRTKKVKFEKEPSFTDEVKNGLSKPETLGKDGHQYVVLEKGVILMTCLDIDKAKEFARQCVFPSDGVYIAKIVAKVSAKVDVQATDFE